jgi:alpha-ketoglutarate-dependent taurine dioxygenase
MNKVDIAVRPLSAAAGAEVTGVDLREDLSDDVKETLRSAWGEHALLLLRGQDVTLEDQVRFGRIFGPISSQGENAAKLGGVTYVSNVAADGTNAAGELTFHIDHSFYPSPLRGIMLYGIEVPPVGGDTMFANARIAYERLPQALKERIADLKALHVYDYAYSRGDRQGARIREHEISADSPRAVHPVVLTHPDTGQKILYVSRRHTDRILDVSEAESEALLDELLTYIYLPDIVYRHHWTAGDVVLWDNLSLQHARSDFDSTYKRHMRRVQIA